MGPMIPMGPIVGPIVGDPLNRRSLFKSI